ncbi:unnamed protein product [Spirodela intermedia]|uniref:Tf2-1-like SH3-like domain-containing protein n=1 Tax=Spirodela intermedia TaxID=51605 RepID=A0A7I8JFF7_SPIIN|nr:unnamed protein product [Spirodela intermedia]CAA6668890.1 unnamed protein product [Spirodela intermedia]
MKSLARKVNEKLSPKFFGPYKIISRMGQTAYKLDLPSASSIHLVFYISQLLRALATANLPQQFSPSLSLDMKWQVQLQSIIDPEVLMEWDKLRS